MKISKSYTNISWEGKFSLHPAVEEINQLHFKYWTMFNEVLYVVFSGAREDKQISEAAQWVEPLQPPWWTSWHMRCSPTKSQSKLDCHKIFLTAGPKTLEEPGSSERNVSDVSIQSWFSCFDLINNQSIQSINYLIPWKTFHQNSVICKWKSPLI